MSSAQTELNEHISVLFQVEKLATEITRLKTQKIDADRRRQANREALRSLYDTERSEDIDADSMWIQMNGTFLKLPLSEAKSHLLRISEEFEAVLVEAQTKLKAVVRELQLIAPYQQVDPKSLEMLLAD